MKESSFVRSTLVAVALAICSPVRVLYAQSAPGNGMNHTDGGDMMNHSDGWLGGGMWVWTVVGVLVVVLMAVVIAKLSKK